jgi:catechol 2,3-dioxygenase-like lactoylglutathione lyase family enzyme
MLANSPIVAIHPATDLERARAFYEDKLGLRLISSSPEELFFEAGVGTMLEIYRRDAPTKAEHTVAGFMVNDIEPIVQHLESVGVPLEHYDLPGLKTDERGILEREGMKAAWITDSEGNILAIVEGVPMSPGLSERQKAHAAGV